MTSTLHTIEFGSDNAGTPIVFLGSLAANCWFWTPQLDAFSPQRHVIAVDLPGHGDSEVAAAFSVPEFADLVLAALDELGVDTFDLVGLSLGGAVAQQLAAHSGRVNKLALLSTNAKFGTPEAWTAKAQSVREGGLHEANAATITNWFTQGWRDEHPARLAFVLSQMDRTPAEGYARACEALSKWDNWEGLKDIAVPTLVVPGAHDGGCTPEVMGKMAEAIPHSEFTVIESSAHLSNLEACDEVTALLAHHFGLVDAHLLKPESETYNEQYPTEVFKEIKED
ncbi:alpha/beta fold hydrolase [Corynebacterium pyruviciproducens]|uniref:Alpha/beta fold hydrolase n=1 Tax=Corynebacterium pyruviciproducens TaxID=598660 RepID=A0AAF1BWW0_9CORY|nr:alpha/beta fold hydrolase [Corynebacterium pyruviciproducens]MDH4658282.1 alpha/beta fold hydrolase [Corynebacterium pyruviciproducens]MDK6565852.1 alpha/beta fold hydrolase [Corynebacterium pyruviciproducens]WOT02782.1 alpha/beta fold hydrolase [Corynebacterium pyruviciproducens]